MSDLIIEEELTNSGYPDRKLRIIAYDNLFALCAHDSRVDQWVNYYLTDQQIEDMIVLLNYYKQRKIAAGREWEGK